MTTTTQTASAASGPSTCTRRASGQAGTENALISTTLEQRAALFEAALADSDDPVGAIAAAYRDFARRHPHLYRLMTERPLDRENLTPGAEERARRPIVEALGGDRDLARAVWAFATG